MSFHRLVVSSIQQELELYCICKCQFVQIVGRNFNFSFVIMPGDPNLCVFAVPYSLADWLDVGNMSSFFEWSLKRRYKNSRKVLRSLSVLSLLDL